MPWLFMHAGHWRIETLVADEFGIILWPCALIILVWLPSENFVEKPSQRQITFVGLNMYQTQVASDYLNLLNFLHKINYTPYRFLMIFNSVFFHDSA